ncbi:hypothetical protein KAU33_15550 [Candidatus Dependentiae bacterium]|nr:hypothetical protein [Candidatus Dependentiae bacterium]
MKRPTIKTIIPKGTEIHSTHPVKGVSISRREQVVDNIRTKRDYLKYCDNVGGGGGGGQVRVDTGDGLRSLMKYLMLIQS